MEKRVILGNSNLGITWKVLRERFNSPLAQRQGVGEGSPRRRLGPEGLGSERQCEGRAEAQDHSKGFQKDPWVSGELKGKSGVRGRGVCTPDFRAARCLKGTNPLSRMDRAGHPQGSGSGRGWQ